MKEVPGLVCLLGIGVAAVVALTTVRQPAPASDGSRSPNPVGYNKLAPSSLDTAPRSIRVALEELEYHDAGFRAAAAGRLIEMGADARPFVEGARRDARKAGKEALAAECQRILDGLGPFKDLSIWLKLKKGLETSDSMYRYLDPPNVRTDDASNRLLAGTFLFGVRGRQYRAVGPPPSIVRIFAYDGRMGRQFELKKWEDLSELLKPATGENEIKETCLLILKVWVREYCPCVDPSDVEVQGLTTVQSPSGVIVKGRVTSPKTGNASFKITFDLDGRIREVTPASPTHVHM